MLAVIKVENLIDQLTLLGAVVDCRRVYHPVLPKADKVSLLIKHISTFLTMLVVQVGNIAVEVREVSI